MIITIHSLQVEIFAHFLFSGLFTSLFVVLFKSELMITILIRNREFLTQMKNLCNDQCFSCLAKIKILHVFVL